MENDLNSDPEAVAIASITKALGSLEETRKVAVLTYILQRLGGSVSSNTLQAEEVNRSADTEGNIKSFLKAKNPQNPYQQVAVLAYFLKKRRDEESVNKKLIEAANDEAGGRTIDNITSVLNDAKKQYQYFGSGPGGKKKLLVFGEDVVDALPNQEKVKELASKQPKKRRHVKGQKKTAKK